MPADEIAKKPVVRQLHKAVACRRKKKY